MDSRMKTLPKSRSNTRISVLAAGSSSGSSKKKQPPSARGSSESTRLVYHHGYGPSGTGSGGGAITGGKDRSAQQGRGGVVGGDGTAVAGGIGGYGSYQPLHPSSNPVEDCLRAALSGLGWCMAALLIGVLLLVFDYARRRSSSPPQPLTPPPPPSSSPKRSEGRDPPWLLFAPFWIGDAIVVVVLARVIAKIASVHFVPSTRNRGGRSRSSGSLNDVPGQQVHNGGGAGSGGSGLAIAPVTLEYFPLLQKVAVSTLGAFFLLLLLATEQVLVCLRWGRGSEAGAAAVPTPLATVAPLLVLEVFLLSKVAIMRTQGWLSGITWSLLFLLTISVAMRSDADSSNAVARAFRSQPWLECLAPLWALNLLYAGVAGYVAANTCAGRFVMAPTQGLCFALFVAALAGTTVAEILFTGDHRFERLSNKVPRVEYLRLDLPLLLVVASTAAFFLAIFLSAEHSVSMLINTRGYDDPLPLCETPNGWEWSGAGKAPWGLLGGVLVRVEKKVALPAGFTGNKKLPGHSFTSDMHVTDAGFSENLFLRTDSGQYVDIYDKL